jgi:hypothetical protein
MSTDTPPQLTVEGDIIPKKPVPLLGFVGAQSSERLSMPPWTRITITTLFNATAALGTGFYASSHAAGLQFLAENSHRMPKSEKGWFIYQRYKTNYKIVRGVQGGVRRIAMWAPIPIVFLWTESMVDEVRGGESKDLASTVVAGVVTGGLFSLFSRWTIDTDVLVSDDQ